MKIKEFKSSIGYLDVQQINSFSGLNIRLNSSKIEKTSFLFDCYELDKNSKNKQRLSWG